MNVIKNGDDNSNSLFGTQDNDVIHGKGGADLIWGYGGVDLLFGDDGDDWIVGGAGPDVINGGTGIDTASYYSSTHGVNVSLTTGLGHGGDAEGDLLSNVENLSGSTWNDTLEGNAGNNSLWGNDQYDTLYGRAGSDKLYGGNGDDVLQGGSGADLLDGGAGFDTADYSDSFAGVVVDLSTNTVSGGTAQGDTILNVEAVTGSALGDKLTGNGGHNSFDGGGGADTIIAGGGYDFLNGDAGNDVLKGGSGNDYIQGGSGGDVMTGGSGADEFQYLFISDSAGANKDTITDFHPAEHDTLNIDRYDGDITFTATPTFKGTAAFDGDNQIRYTHVNGDTHVQVSVDGGVDMEIILKGTIDLHASDFVF